MAVTVTGLANQCAGGGHGDITATIDGETLTIRPDDLQRALTTAEKLTLMALLARLLRQKGVPLASFLNRVLLGDEATNVKAYDLLPPGSAIAKTNIGTSYVNVLPGLNGERSLVDFTGCTQFRIILTANLVGTGPFGLRVVKDSDNTVLFENASVAQTGERELDTDWQSLPAGFTDLVLVRMQAKSTVGADDPVFRRCTVLVR